MLNGGFLGFANPGAGAGGPLRPGMGGVGPLQHPMQMGGGVGPMQPPMYGQQQFQAPYGVTNGYMNATGDGAMNSGMLPMMMGQRGMMFQSPFAQMQNSPVLRRLGFGG